MSILTTENLCVSFGDFDLFAGVSVTIANNSKVGLIGPNGAGKTTLLTILAGLNQASQGKVNLARGRRLGYLRQEAIEAFGDRDNTVYSEMLAVFSDLIRQGEELAALEACMAQGDYDDALLETYGERQLAFEQAGGYDYELRLQQTLSGLGLGKAHWRMPLSHLSGGQKTRALLARLLLERPDLLILDEPTNHLDIEAVEWLERTLLEWPGAVLIVSHDRYFLDNVVDTIWELGRRGIETYSGNYSGYLLQRQERWEYYERSFKEEKARLLNEVDYVQRNWVRASTHAQALGRLRRLSRDLAVVETYGIMALRSGKKWSEFELSVRPLDVIEAVRKVNAIHMDSNRPPRIAPRLADSHLSGNIVLRAAQVSVGYPGKLLFSGQDVELRRGECAALIGPNGAGKTSFIKTMLGQIEPLAGEVRLGAGLQIGYFAQAQDALDDSQTVLDELLRHKPMEPGQARNLLAGYLFQGDDVFKPVAALSGGERARLALAILTLEGANFLVLDEPTNHLDIPAREALQEVLEDFSGTILLVSHDRYLINRLATQIWDLQHGKLSLFHGSYREYLLRRAPLNGRPGAARRQTILAPKPAARDNSKATRKQQEALTQLEQRIREQEAAVQRLSGEMQQAGGGDFGQVHKLSQQMAHAQARLDELMHQWEKLAV